MPCRLLALLLALSAVLPCAAIDKARYRELNAQARAQAKQQDWQAVRATLEALGKQLPAPTPRYLLTVASIETHLGHKQEALQWLAKYAALGLQYDVAGDADLKPLLDEPGFPKIAEQMKANGKEIRGSELACELPMPDLMPEDVTYEEANGTFLVSSVQHHTLYRLSLPPEGEVACDLKEVALEETVKRWPTLAVAADPRRNLIWLTTSAMPGFAGIAKEDEGKAALLAVNERGRVQRSVELATGEPAVLGDMALAADGTVYVTDSLGGGVYELRGKGRDTATWLRTAKLEKIADGLFSPQTPVLAADRKRLFVADYTIGIAVVDLATGKVEYLPHPENVAVTGIDGLYLVGNSLIAIQNGTQPERVLKLALDGAQRAITSAEVLEQATERLGEATHGVARGRGFYVSANVGWDKVDDSGQLKDGQKFTAPVLLRFALEPRK